MEDSISPRPRTVKRPRPVISCLNCRRKKLRCSRTFPCDKCIRSGRRDECQYAPGQEPTGNDHIEDELLKPSKKLRLSAAEPSATLEASVSLLDDLQVRVQQLEKSLTAQRCLDTTSLVEEDDAARPAAPAKQSSRKFDSRFDRSYLHRPMACQVRHRINAYDLTKGLHSQFPVIQSFVDKLGQDPVPEELSSLAAKLRMLHNRTRKYRPPRRSFHVHNNLRDVLSHMQQLLPDKATCTTLIELYFHNFEFCTRVLHRPSTLMQFRAYFDNQLLVGKRTFVLPMLLCVVSVASSLGTLPECENPKLHGHVDGVGAYHLIRNYLDLLTDSQWRQLPIIQVALLSLKFHKSSSLSAVETWCWSGQVLRRATAAGLLSSAIDEKDLFVSEMSRRLWLTALENDLTLAIASDMPLNCPRLQTKSPISVDDEKIYPGMFSRPPCQGTNTWTDGICQYVLAQSFNDRHSAYELIQSEHAPAYQTVLQHTRHLEQVIHDLPKTFRLSVEPEDSSDTPYRLMAKMELDFLLRRPLNACYAPYAAQMPADDQFKEARIPWIQSCTFGICFQDLFDPKYPMLDLPRPEGLWDFFYCTHKWDLSRFMLANCLELQRLHQIGADAKDVVSPVFHGHTLRAFTKVMGWSIEGIIKSLEETLDPMTRRMGRFASDLRELVRWTAVMGSFRVSTECGEDVVKNELQKLVAAVRAQLQSRPAPEQHENNGSIRGIRADVKWLQRYLEDAEDALDLEDEPSSTFNGLF